MFRILMAHGLDPRPTQRPLITGGIAGLLATAPAGAVFATFGTLQTVADRIMRMPRPLTALITVGAFVAAGLIYGALFRRAANDRRGGWLFGSAYGFLLWIVAPVVVLPLLRGNMIAAGDAAIGFLLGFLIWGCTLGFLFPHIHGRFRTVLGASPLGQIDPFGPDAAAGRGLKSVERRRRDAA